MSRILHTVKRVLTSTSARKIDFRLGTIRVDDAGLGAILLLVSSGVITVKTLPMPPDVSAAYVPASNTLKVPRDNFGANAHERAAILHECVHALHDMFGGGSYIPKRAGFRFTPRSEDEAAAYVAGALYYFYETGGGALSGSHLVSLAAQIAERIADGGSPVVTEIEASALRVAVVTDPGYRYGFNDLTIADGPKRP